MASPNITIVNLRTMSSSGDILEGFPHPTITPVIGIPTYESIAEINLKLNANAASVHSNLGDGAHGLLALAIDPAVYNTISLDPFVPPANPGANPVLPHNSTDAFSSPSSLGNTLPLYTSGKNTCQPTKHSSSSFSPPSTTSTIAPFATASPATQA
jgi:hypothetical protein